MKKIYILLFAALALNTLNAQTVSTFENITLDSNSYRDGTDSSDRTGFASGHALFANTYTGWWSGGFAVSNKTDVKTDSLTLDYIQMYTGVQGTGALGSTNYCIGQQNAIVKLTDSAERFVTGFYITNSNYSYLSMKWGDGFGKQFTDSDYFNLHIYGYLNGVKKDSSVRIPLALGKNLMVNWEWVDTKVIGQVDSLRFEMESSDSGAFGINTPTFFCLDELTTASTITGLTRAEKTTVEVIVYPNPAATEIHITSNNANIQLIQLSDITGKKIISSSLRQMDISALPNGIYFLTIETDKGLSVQKLIKTN